MKLKMKSGIALVVALVVAIVIAFILVKSRAPLQHESHHRPSDPFSLPGHRLW
jgi:ABC-type Fe3+ transport system permease subunit